MKTFVLLILMSLPGFAKFEIQTWEPDPIIIVDEDGNIRIILPPYENIGTGREL